MKHNYSNQINAFDAKTNFSKLLQRVKKGEKITILKHDIPVAVMVPVSTNTQTLEIQQVIDDIHEFCKNKKLRGLSINELKNEGRK